MLIMKGHVTNDKEACFGVGGPYGCYEDGTLDYAPSGNYSGPWH